jgi:hypothetical protein
MLKSLTLVAVIALVLTVPTTIVFTMRFIPHGQTLLAAYCGFGIGVLCTMIAMVIVGNLAMAKEEV